MFQAGRITQSLVDDLKMIGYATSSVYRMLGFTKVKQSLKDRIINLIPFIHIKFIWENDYLTVVYNKNRIENTNINVYSKIDGRKIYECIGHIKTKKLASLVKNYEREYKLENLLSLEKPIQLEEH